MEGATMIIDVSDPDAASRANRQTKKLHLRNAGFKARDMPSRNRTPSKPNSTVAPSWGSGLTPVIDADNLAENRTPNSVLREISNSSKRRKKQTRSRIDDSCFVYQDENTILQSKSTNVPDVADVSPEGSVAADLLTISHSPLHSISNRSPQRTRSPTKAAPSTRPRRQSIGIDTSRYIEHLEAELAAAQTQLTAMTSPTVMQARSQKMRALNAETRALHDEVASWERKFHDRVQEEIAERTKMETALKSRVRLLEGDATDYSQKIQDLQAQLDQTQVTMAVAESANVELERRIDAISGLLTSPKKSDLERSASTARQRHSRQRSMLPRFPTTGSLNLTFTPRVPADGGSPITPTGESFERYAAAQKLQSPDACNNKPLEDNGEDLARTSSNETFVESARSKRASWAPTDTYTSLDAVAASQGKPSRRMRRFYAGTAMPKPLLLPSKSSYALTSPQKDKSPTPASPPTAALADLSSLAQMVAARNFECLLSTVPGNGRRRALTSIEDVAAAMRRASNPFMSPMPYPAAMATGPSRPPTADSTSTIKSAKSTDSDFTVVGEVSSLGPQPIGRNLFDELQRAKSVGPTEADCSSFEPCISARSMDSNRTERRAAYATTGLHKRGRPQHRRSLSDSTALTLMAALDEDDSSSSEEETEPAFTSVMSETFRRTYETSRRCMAHAQSVALENASVQRLQWWLVQLFLGPMVTKRMMATAMRQSQRQRRAQHVEMLTGGNIASRSFARSHMWQPNIWVEGMQVVSKREQPMTWIQKHSPWLWIRFSIALLFAIGAAIRDGPSAVMGLQEQEDKIE